MQIEFQYSMPPVFIFIVLQPVKFQPPGAFVGKY